MNLYLVLNVLAALLANFEMCLGDNLKLLILHNNDMHAQFEETSVLSGVCKDKSNCYGGFARVLHVIREARKAAQDGKGPNVLYLNAGDTFTGSALFTFHKAKIATTFLNLLQPDVASLGNHEFDYGVQGLIPFINEAQFPIVAANLDLSNQPDLAETNITKSYVLEVAGRKIGIIGYLTKETAIISNSENVRFMDEIDSIKKESERLDQQGVKIIIALGHSGYKIDKEIAAGVPLVDLVVGGHSNTFLWNGPPPNSEEPDGPYPTVITQSSGKKVPVVQAYAFTKYMGRLNIVFNDNGDAIEYYGQPQFLDSTIPQEKDVLDLINEFKEALISFNREVVGRTRVILDGSAVNCRQKECNFGNLITDAFISYHSAKYHGSFWTDAPIAFLSGGSIRNSIEPKVDGIITKGELLGVLPYGSNIVTVDLNGTDLLKCLEIGVRGNGETSYGEFLQTSGLHYRFDRSRPVGSRIIEAKVRCGSCSIPTYQPIIPHQTYRIITTSFLSKGGDGFFVLRDNGRNVVVEDVNDLDTLIWYITKKTPVYAEEEERIVVISKNDNENKNSIANARFVSVFLILLVSIHMIM